MAHWAEIDENNIVIRVLVGDNNEPDEGYQWLINNLGGKWIKTSYNTYGGIHYDKDGNPDNKISLRKNYAGIGYSYDEKRDAFIPPKPQDDWVWILNEDSCLWTRIDAGTIEPLR